MANWNSNFEVMLEGRPELRQELARYQLDAMVPMVQVMEWLRQFAGLSESITTHARAQGSRMRDLEAQVEALATTVDKRRADALQAYDLMHDVTMAALRETDAEKAHNADGSWPPGTVENLQVHRRLRAEAVERLRERAQKHQLEAMGVAPEAPTVTEAHQIKDVSHASLDPATGKISVAVTVEHNANCTGCAACETAGA